MYSKITEPTAKTKSIHSVIQVFQDTVEGVEQRIGAVEDCLNSRLDRDQELILLRNKLMDLEDNFLQWAKGADIKAFLKSILPTLMGIIFSPFGDPTSTPHGPNETRNIRGNLIFWVLCHEQEQQLLTAAWSHGSYDYEGHEICITADFFWETWLQLRKLDIKFGLFEPPSM
ncbi:hypothetical protein NDU88_006779 [Pleurodeles waltl]|uniref:Uncharacterized protein n=1 Tax=Pleurodeles waltl TaxID=8319 RepID=A0AAV7SQF9_PLEWA|nr:hypothetical protein NDU88_006779 [Pleurodeles waltl]